MEILDGRLNFFQWDLDVYIKSGDFEIGDEIHFDNGMNKLAQVLKVKDVEGTLAVEVPNDMLQVPTPIRVYRYVQDELGDRTAEERTFDVKQRAKPADYVYTPTEVWRYEALEKRVEELEQSGGASGENGATFIPSVSEEGMISWTNDKNLPNPTPRNIKPQKGVDYWTPQDRADIVQDVLKNFVDVSEVGR